MFNKRYILIGLLLITNIYWLKADITIPDFFGDHMVFQRNELIKIWGWTDKDESIEISFNGHRANTIANKDSIWMITFPAMIHGGPYTMTIKGKNNSITISDIVIGDVWLCSGQSNMEWQVQQSENALDEIENANYPNIRHIKVPRKMKQNPQGIFCADWEVCTPETVGHFSAVAYFYARELNRELNIPIGIINASWGGTDIEPWTSAKTFEKLPANVKKKYNADIIANLDKYTEKSKGGIEDFFENMKNDPALAEKWYKPNTNTATWSTIDSLSNISNSSNHQTDGYLWLQHTIELPINANNQTAIISLGTIENDDITWINGVEVGRTKGWDTPRLYIIPPNILKEGQNIITIRKTKIGTNPSVNSSPQDLFLELIGEEGNSKLPLIDKWKYKESVSLSNYEIHNITPNTAYASLYNGMIHPLTPFRIQGVIWYQGENNANAAYNYRILFSALISDWRKQWGYEFPFYWVQLANYDAQDKLPNESTWAELREAQTMALSIKNTGQAVTIDIGNPYDIHPMNKQEVGYRLALIALNKTYKKESIIYSGPTFKSYKIKEDKVIITLDTHGSELAIHNKYGYIKGFSIAGEDKVFEWAKACIKDGKIIVQGANTPKPQAVRYAWGNNPEGNIFNTEGLPATPFRTDSWKGMTEK